jgi:hypothetical protein
VDDPTTTSAGSNFGRSNQGRPFSLTACQPHALSCGRRVCLSRLQQTLLARRSLPSPAARLSSGRGHAAKHWPPAGCHSELSHEPEPRQRPGTTRVGNTVAAFRCIGGLDATPGAVPAFECRVGAHGSVLDVSDDDQYRAFGVGQFPQLGSSGESETLSARSRRSPPPRRSLRLIQIGRETILQRHERPASAPNRALRVAMG